MTSLAVIVLAYEMQRELPRTLETLRRAVAEVDDGVAVTVTVIDNGSPVALDVAPTEGWGIDLHLERIPPEEASSSPCSALNEAVRRSGAEFVLIAIDGARMFSPGILREGLACLSDQPEAFAYAVSMHLGAKRQQDLTAEGWTQGDEDRLLASVPWREDPYQLFRVSAWAPSTPDGFGGYAAESCALLVRRSHYLEIGGFDPVFASPGGGYANIDFFNRLHERPGAIPICLDGEATFHQVHGGVASNRRADLEGDQARFKSEYAAIRGRSFSSSWRPPLLRGVRGPAAASAYRPPPPPVDASRGTFVLGMHRSGTSCLTAMLAASGVDDCGASTWNPHNRSGNRERRDVNLINDRSLALSGGSWRRPPAGLIWMHREVEDAQALVQEWNDSGAPWVMKDPRCVLTLPLWRTAAHGFSAIGIFRHPLAVATSLAIRQGFEIDDAISLWCDYNERLLAVCEDAPFPLVCFDRSRDELVEDLLAHRPELDRTACTNAYREELVHNSATTVMEECAEADRALEIYRRLLDRAGIDPKELPSHAATDSGTLRRALASERLGDVAQAIALYRTCAGQRHDLWHRLIDLAVRSHDPRVDECCRDAIDTLGEDPAILIQWATWCWDRGDRDGAIERARRAVVAQPSWDVPRRKLGTWLLNAGREEEAIVQLRPLASDGEAWAGGLLIVADLKRLGSAQACAAMMGLVDGLPGDQAVALLLRLARRILADDAKRAADLLDDATRRGIPLAPLCAQAARLAFDLGTDPAPYLADGLELSPDDEALHHLSGRAATERDDHRRALYHYQRAGSSTSALMGLARAFDRCGRRDDALSALDRLLAARPEHQPAIGMRSRLVDSGGRDGVEPAT